MASLLWQGLHLSVLHAFITNSPSLSRSPLGRVEWGGVERLVMLRFYVFFLSCFVKKKPQIPIRTGVGPPDSSWAQ